MISRNTRSSVLSAASACAWSGSTCSGSWMRRAVIQRSISRWGISATGSTKSIMSVTMAARGMLANAASSGCCAMVMPPSSFTRVMPTDPSDPAPEKIMPTARSRWLSASERRNRSMAARRSSFDLAFFTRRKLSTMVSTIDGAIT